MVNCNDCDNKKFLKSVRYKRIYAKRESEWQNCMVKNGNQSTVAISDVRFFLLVLRCIPTCAFNQTSRKNKVSKF